MFWGSERMKKAVCIIAVLFLLSGCGEKRLISEEVSKIKVDYYSVKEQDFVITDEDQIAAIIDYINAIDCEVYEDYELRYGPSDKLLLYDGEENEIGAVYTMADQLWILGECYRVNECDTKLFIEMCEMFK